MSSYISCSIKQYFPFPRVKIIAQSVTPNAALARIDIKPDSRFTPVCHACGEKTPRVHATARRAVRDLNFATAEVWLVFTYRKVKCSNCGCICIEYLGFVEPYAHVTNRLARYIHDLCKVMSIKEVAKLLNLDWKVVKRIDKRFLEEEFGGTDYQDLKILAVDEISRGPHHDYLTVVLDYPTGRIVWIGEGRKMSTLEAFFESMPEENRNKIEAVVMDMWDPFISAVKKWCSNAKIVFDLFHVVQAFNKVINNVRNQEYRKATEEEKKIIKGSKYLLLKNKINLRQEEKPHLKELLELNQSLFTVYLLKDALKRIWKYKYTRCAERALENWCALAQESRIPSVIQFAKRLERYREGILNHCRYSIHTGKLEGVNNKLKVIKRNAYGFLDTKYFILKAKQAFPGIRIN